MPLYEYRCKKCNNTFEVYKPINRKDEKQKCPLCGNFETERLISSFLSKSGSCSFSYNFGS